jgi:hypothetical protein
MQPQKENKFTEICALTFNSLYYSNEIYVCNNLEDIRKVAAVSEFWILWRKFHSGKEKN